MTRRRRSQAVPQADVGSRPRSRARRPIRTVIGGLILVLILIVAASIVAGLPGVAESSPPSGPLPIAFGYALDPDTYLVTQPANRFEPSDPFAYSVSPPIHPGVPQVYVAVVTFRAGEEIVLQAPSPQSLLPEPVSFGYETRTADLIQLFGYGRFTMKIYLAPDGPVYAQGRFEVAEPELPR